MSKRARAKRRQPLIVKEVRFSSATDEVSRRRISEVYRLLLGIRKAKDWAPDKNGTPPPGDNNVNTMGGGVRRNGPYG